GVRMAPEPAPGYGLRTFRRGDEADWLAILQASDLGAWDRARLDDLLRGATADVPEAGIFFATAEDRPIGAACTRLHPGADGSIAELGWVAVSPEHRGHGLGLQVCRAVLGHIRDLGHEYAYLLTDDHRLPAIATYLRLGFEPEIVDASHPARWAAI